MAWLLSPRNSVQNLSSLSQGFSRKAFVLTLYPVVPLCAQISGINIYEVSLASRVWHACARWGLLHSCGWPAVLGLQPACLFRPQHL